MVAIYIGHSLQIAHLVGEFFTTCNGQVPHLRLVNCGLALFLLAKNSLNNLRYCDYRLPSTDAGLRLEEFLGPIGSLGKISYNSYPG